MNWWDWNISSPEVNEVSAEIGSRSGIIIPAVQSGKKTPRFRGDVGSEALIWTGGRSHPVMQSGWFCSVRNALLAGLTAAPFPSGHLWMKARPSDTKKTGGPCRQIPWPPARDYLLSRVPGLFSRLIAALLRRARSKPGHDRLFSPSHEHACPRPPL